MGVTRAHAARSSARPGSAYVYFSYGMHSLLNAVAEPEGVGAAVLIRALEPRRGHRPDARAPRRSSAPESLCSGPGKLTQALGIGLELNESSLLDGPVEILAAAGSAASAHRDRRADRHHEGGGPAVALLRRGQPPRVAAAAGGDARRRAA